MLAERGELECTYKGTTLTSLRYYSKVQIIEKMAAVDIFGIIKDAKLVVVAFLRKLPQSVSIQG